MKKGLKIERYNGYFIGFWIRNKPFLWDGLTDRAIRKSKDESAG